MQNKITQILEFMRILDKVCLVKRATLLSDGSSETDSSHSFKLAWLLMMVYPYLKHEYNFTRLLELALVHDIAEAEIGDCPKAVQRANPEAKKLKDAQELAAMQKYKSNKYQEIPRTSTPMEQSIYEKECHPIHADCISPEKSH